jgi:hypothetical protein
MFNSLLPDTLYVQGSVTGHPVVYGIMSKNEIDPGRPQMTKLAHVHCMPDI